MKKISKTKLKLFLVAIILLLVPSNWIYAQSESDSSLVLLEKYAPVLYFHTAELFRPQPDDVLVDNARLLVSR